MNAARGQSRAPAVPGERTLFAFVRAWLDAPRLRTVPPGTTAYMRLRAHTAPTGPVAQPRWTNLADLSPYALCAVVGAEDPAFFQHRGIWWSQLAGQTVSALRRGRRIGGVSTLTQQLARNLYLHGGRSAGRKVAEMLLARRLEQVLDKARILELYVNVVEWGPDTWGIEDAARRWFGTTAGALNPFQAVVLASLLPAPAAPLAGRNLARALGSQLRLLHFLYGAGVMSLPEWQDTGERLSRLAAELRAGRGANAVLRNLGDLPYDARPERGVPPTAAELLDSRCGLQLRVAYGEILPVGARPDAVMAGLPLRWTGRPPA